MIAMDNLDRRLLNITQQDFPMEPRPFSYLGAMLGVDEEEVIDRLKQLKDGKIVRQISAIFDTRSLGYQSSLVATKVAPDRLKEAARVINEHPGVSHNYLRNHSFNIWYTVAIPPASSLETTVRRLHELAGAESTRLMPTLRLFKIGVQLDMTGEQDITAHSPKSVAYTHKDRERAQQNPVTERDIPIIRAMQDDIEMTSRPFLAAAQRLGVTEEELLAEARRLQQIGHLRRFATILYHRRAGYAANGMAVWKVPAEKAIEMGELMATFSAVSHCYLRPTYPDWPYNVFTMIHGRKVKDCYKVADAISQTTSLKEYEVLFSTKEFKKTRVRYFTQEMEEWERLHLAPSVVA